MPYEHSPQDLAHIEFLARERASNLLPEEALQKLKIEFKKGPCKTAGCFYPYENRIRIWISIHRTLDQILSTLLHELAHAVSWAKSHSLEHDEEWKSWSVALGGTTTKTHRIDLSLAYPKKYFAILCKKCGETVNYTWYMKQKMERGTKYRCPFCQKKL